MLMRSLEGVAIWSQIKIRFVSGLESCPHNRIQFVSLFHGLKLALERIENFFNMQCRPRRLIIVRRERGSENLPG